MQHGGGHELQGELDPGRAPEQISRTMQDDEVQLRCVAPEGNWTVYEDPGHGQEAMPFRRHLLQRWSARASNEKLPDDELVFLLQAMCARGLLSAATQSSEGQLRLLCSALGHVILQLQTLSHRCRKLRAGS